MFAKSEEKTSHRFGIVVLKTEISVSRPIENSGVEWVLVLRQKRGKTKKNRPDSEKRGKTKKNRPDSENVKTTFFKKNPATIRRTFDEHS
jgi:hypothetical protein